MVPNAVASGGLSEPDSAVLIVEDDVLIRAAAAQHLRGTGFEVLEAVDVEEALQILRASEHVGVVFSDIKLPGERSGLELLEIVRLDFPRVKIFFTSGVVGAAELDGKGVTFVRKPYFLFEVERHIRSLLAEG